MVKIQRYMSEDEILEQYRDMRLLLILDDKTSYLDDGGFKNVWVECACKSNSEYAEFVNKLRSEHTDLDNISNNYFHYSSYTDSSPYPSVGGAKC